MAISFTVPTIPVAQPRQKHALIGGRVRNYMPTKHPVNAFKAAVQLAASQVYSGAPITFPLSLTLVFVFPRPSNRIWKTKTMPREPKASKPDCDNLAKSFLDGLNGLLYVDDSQVVQLFVSKWVAAGDEQPHVEAEFTVLYEF
jgi:Holliday junction resolvase RusA-like endonuclease